ncbi:pyridoxamine 5'-phosphate oxidase-domain-containing protein [Hypoxylon trugodes]|uniref:pyridoxamine 5'-phosphate oxidase-domain-containing protein n=1 Tax=Hypoxylon trugodes TaxID=326681 RepID=UPI0021935EC9|nr:pyridoxamine 5'-phosphate oxidase-domain-containing protein [Hypoxylon trugodes]KAI1394072.1 pyridoxamine 5'-phosphate oxidase-domain-containing protein [Hypoxylon trugodes]
MHYCIRHFNILPILLQYSQRQFIVRPTCGSFLVRGYSAMVTPSSHTPTPAPWRHAFLEHIQTVPSPEFTLATVRKSVSPAGVTTYAPRTRTCAFRGFFAGLPVNPKNDAELNPDVYDSDLLAFTTDRRMEKLIELFGIEAGKEKENEDRLKGSGGGAPVEAVFWIKEKSTQWRFRGTVYVLAPDIETSEAGEEVRSTLLSHIRRKNSSGGSEGKEWSFAREITAHFGNNSPVMRGSFRNPPPSVPVALPVDDERLKLGQKVTDLNDEVARSNYRVVVIVPEELDRVDLSNQERARRWVYTYAGEEQQPQKPGGVIEDGWEKVEVWP